MTLPDLLKLIRQEAKLSQYALAKKSGISRFRISMIECDYTNISPDELDDYLLSCAPSQERLAEVAELLRGLK